MKTKPQKTCPPEFKLEISHRVWAAQNVPGVDIEFETGAMMDYEFARARSNWNAVWRNWMREQYRKQNRYQPSHYVPAVDVEMDKLKALRVVWGIPDFRDNVPRETISDYRLAMSRASDAARAPKLRVVK